MPHHLLVVRRDVPPERREEYLAGWMAAEAAASAAGARAWLFAARGDPRSLLEFFEWGDDAGDAALPDVAAALAALAGAFGGREERWDELNPDRSQEEAT